MATYRQDQTLVLKTVGQLYEAAANPEYWPQTLKAMAHLFDAFMAQLSSYNPSDASLNFGIIHGLEYDQEGIDRYAALSSTDPMSQAAVLYPGKAIRCGQVASREEIEATRLYKEVLYPANIEYRMATLVGDPGKHVMALALSRGRDAPDFDDDDVALISEFTPYFRRAMELYSNLSSSQTAGNVALAALDSLSIGIAILDANASTLHVNVAGQTIIEDRGGLVIRNGHLTAERAEDAAELAHQVRRMAAMGSGASGVRGGSVPGEMIAVHRAAGGSALPLTISPLNREEGLDLPFDRVGQVVIVVFTDPDRQLEVPSELQQRLYGLTPGEALLLEKLVMGLSLEEAAADMGIVRETARKRLGDVFQKTGTNRQAGLIRLVLANPVWITEHAKRPALIHAS